MVISHNLYLKDWIGHRKTYSKKMGAFYHLCLPDRKWRSSFSLNGKVFIVTGGSAGIGLETVRGLAARGARVIVGCRNTTKGEDAVREIVLEGKDVVVKELDLASFTSIRKFAEDILVQERKIHVLINNAGVAGCPYQKTEDGFEMQLGVNHLGHFLLTMLLVDRMKESTPARIVNVSSIAHFQGKIHFEDINMEKRYGPLKAYRQSKLANILFTKELATRLSGTGVTTYCLHPGIIHTDLGRHLGDSLGNIWKRIYYLVSWLFFKNVKDGARTTLYCATEESISNQSGYYYSGCRQVEPSSKAKEEDAARTLWELSELFTRPTLT